MGMQRRARCARTAFAWAWTRRSAATLLAVGLCAGLAASESRAQSYGIEFHNTLMPVSGAMGGASIARPQDCLSAINGNPATLAAFDGTQFSFGGAWAEATYDITQLTTLPLVGVDPYSAKSNQPGGAAGNIGVTQSLDVIGMPATFGLGFFTNAGAGVDFRGVPESNGTSAQYLALDITPALGIQLTDNLSAGAAFTLGTSFLDGPFADFSSMSTAYGIRGTIGLQYALSETTWVGAYWQSKKHLHFEDAAVFSTGPFAGQSFDARLDHPENVGLGIADQSLMDGKLLLAMDVLYKQYAEADFFSSIYKNQWVYQFGAQYAVNSKFKIRAGYSYNTNPMKGPTITDVGGVPVQDGVPGLRYIQGQFAAIGQHHLTGGVGISNVLPHVDMDMVMGGMFRQSEEFTTTIATVESYWVGSYLTWRFGAGDAR